MLLVATYSLISLFIAWIWVDYFRLIDVHNKNSLFHAIAAFILGGSSVFIVLGAHAYLFANFSLQINGNLLNDLAYAIFQVGMLEEFSKIFAFFVFFLLFKSHLKEPIDYLMYVSICALGFSAVEHVMYFSRSGPEIINGRAILSTVGHMFDTSIIAYGLILFKFKREKNSFLTVVICFLLAALAHGIYDFFLMYPPLDQIGWIFTILYFLVTISVFSVILNNSINNSPYFSYKELLDSSFLFKRLLIYYSIVFSAQFLLTLLNHTLEWSIQSIFLSILFTGTIIILTIGRLSRFNLVKGRWEKIKLEFPFKFNTDNSIQGRSRISIKGENFNETHINPYMERYFYLKPISPKSRYLQVKKMAYMEHKVVSKKNEVFYIIRIYDGDQNSNYTIHLLRAKFTYPNMVKDTYPITGVLKVENEHATSNAKSIKKYAFKEYAVLLPAD
jgi:RsiW-degrading membrane proteinase PrsW (M82 family)